MFSLVESKLWKVPFFLSQIARDLFVMQVSSDEVASESAFNISVRLIDPHRSCLSHYYMVDGLMCT